jgi:hypothetical protein
VLDVRRAGGRAGEQGDRVVERACFAVTALADERAQVVVKHGWDNKSADYLDPFRNVRSARV